MGEIVMSNEEINQVEIFEKLKRREIKQGKAAGILGISVRQVKRKLRKYKLDGAKSLVHKTRGKTSKRKISQEKLDKAMVLIKDEYHDFGPTLANEKLDEIHKIKLSVERLRQEMIKVGIWKTRKKRKANSHQLRERRSCFGELSQLDGSPHDWFEGRAPKCNLNVLIDDATGFVLAQFSEAETTQDYFKLVEMYFLEYGIPLSFYTDMHSVFKINKPGNLDSRKPSSFDKYEGLTQFGRMCKQLSIELIYATTAQAKGRVERVNKTLQDRLVKEMRLEGISNIEDANKFLPKYMEKFNKRFSDKPKSNLNINRKLPKNINLEKIISVQTRRVLSKNLTFQYNNIIFQIKTKRSAFTLRKTKVTICERYDGTMKIYDLRGKLLDYSTIKQLPKQHRANSKQINQLVDDILVKQGPRSKKSNWESSDEELKLPNCFFKPAGTV